MDQPINEKKKNAVAKKKNHHKKNLKTSFPKKSPKSPPPHTHTHKGQAHRVVDNMQRTHPAMALGEEKLRAIAEAGALVGLDLDPEDIHEGIGAGGDARPVFREAVAALLAQGEILEAYLGPAAHPARYYGNPNAFSLEGRFLGGDQGGLERKVTRQRPMPPWLPPSTIGWFPWTTMVRVLVAMATATATVTASFSIWTATSRH